VLTEKYSGEGEKFSLLLLVDYDFNILAKASGNTPLSSCFFSQCAQVSGKSTENHNNNFVHDGDVWGMNFFLLWLLKMMTESGV